MTIIPLVGGALFAVVGVFVLVDHFRFTRKATKTKAIVTDYHQYQSKDTDNMMRTFYKPYFEFAVSGEHYRVKSRLSFRYKKFPIGQQIDILYIEGDENNARIDKGSSVVFGLFFVGLSLPFLYLGIVKSFI
ncbi:DUF3592 domain-containing protein [Thalassotalea ganghwensis]